jgi:hypothetical protein
VLACVQCWRWREEKSRTCLPERSLDVRWPLFRHYFGTNKMEGLELETSCITAQHMASSHPVTGECRKFLFRPRHGMFL